MEYHLQMTQRREPKPLKYFAHHFSGQKAYFQICKNSQSLSPTHPIMENTQNHKTTNSPAQRP